MVRGIRGFLLRHGVLAGLALVLLALVPTADAVACSDDWASPAAVAAEQAVASTDVDPDLDDSLGGCLHCVCHQAQAACSDRLVDVTPRHRATAPLTWASSSPVSSIDPHGPDDPPRA